MKNMLTGALLGSALIWVVLLLFHLAPVVHAAAPTTNPLGQKPIQPQTVDLEKLRYDMQQHVAQLERQLDKAVQRIGKLERQLANAEHKLEQTRVQGTGGRQQLVTALEGVSNRLNVFEAVMSLDEAGKFTLTANDIDIQATNLLKLEGALAGMKAGSLFFDAAMTSIDNVLKTHTLIAEQTVSQSYSPGAGNIW